MFELRCRDVGFDCPGVVQGATTQAVLSQAAAHALQVHGVQVTPELAEKVATLIRETGSAHGGGEGP